MNELVKGILIGLVPGLLVSVITSLLTLRLSLKQFYSQRWWERKAEAYSQIMEQLSYLQYYYGEWAGEDLGIKAMSSEKKRELHKRYNQARESITRVAAMGSYVVSDSTSAALTKLLDEFSKTDSDPNWEASLGEHYQQVQKCIATVREDAKKALTRVS